jgi:hypothetical protein
MNGNPEHETPATDVLAAEEFAVPAPDPALRPEHLELPANWADEEPRDVLAAEEFAMPAPGEAHTQPDSGRRRLPVVRLVALNLPPALLGLWLWRRVRRRHS